MGLFLSPLFVFLLYQLTDFLRWVADKYIFVELHTYQQTINRLARELNFFNDLNHIMDLLLGTVRQTLQLEKIGLILFRRQEPGIERQFRLIGFSQVLTTQLLENESFLKYLKEANEAITADELISYFRGSKFKQDSIGLAIIEKITALKISAILPLFSGRQLVAILLLGQKESNEAFTGEDLKLLDSLAAQAGVAIDNAMLYQKINNFNQTLQGKVDEQTSELRAQADHLKKLLQMRSEFLDIASHQLRTPVSVILGTISMFKEGSVSKLPIEQQERFIDNIYQKSLKLNSIVKDILNASEMDTDEFAFTEDKLQKISVSKAIKTVQANFIDLAKEKGLVLKVKLPEEDLFISSVGDYLEQAIANLVDNAINYTNEGEIVISLTAHHHRAIISVRDTGIGIPKDDQVKLFGKFKRGSEAKAHHTDGSGLGLFIVRKIVKAHFGGRINFQSQPNEGSVFVISFPLASE